MKILLATKWNLASFGIIGDHMWGGVQDKSLERTKVQESLEEGKILVEK